MSRIRHKIVALALVLTLLPAVPLSLFTAKLLDRSARLQTDPALVSALDAGIAETRDALARHKSELTARLERGGLAAGDRSWSWSADAPVHHDVPEPMRAWIERAGEGAAPERIGDDLVVLTHGADGSTVLHAAPLPAQLVQRATRIAEGRAFLNVLQTERARVQRGFFLPFILAYAVLAILGIVTGSVLAGRLARPLETLAESAERTSLGSIDTEVARTDHGEVGELQTAFNRMIRRLASQKDELSRLERLAAWREIAQSLAHEIKNPLTPIQLAVQELRDRYPGSDDRYGALLSDCGEIVDEEVASLRRLVREFSEFARLPEPVKKAGHPAELLRELGKLYGERVVVSTIGEQVVWFDREEMKRALINLVDNGLAACESAGRAPRVTLQSSEERGMLVIAIEDHGTGLSEDKRTKIFEPHFTTKTDGMGLGLPIVQGIVFGHGGTIEVESEEGAGTTFRLLLPMGEETG